MLLSERDRLHAYFSNAAPMTILGIQDTTDLDFTGNQISKKLGSLNYANRKGYYAHNHLLCDSTGVSLGLYNQTLWNRDPTYFGQNRTMWSLENKESARWLKEFENFQSFFAQFPQHTAFDICDREADFYELFAARKAENVHLIIRSDKDKTLCNDEKLWQSLDNELVEEIYLTQIYDEKGGKHDIAFQIKYTAIKIPPNYRATRDQPDNCMPVELYGIVIEQVSPLMSWQKKVVKWRLLTTMPINSFAQATQILLFYIERWRIEDFHYVLKQGAKIEKTQFKEPPTVENAIAFYSLLSWKILNLRYASTKNPNENIENLGFDRKQYEIAVLFVNKKQKTDFNPNPERPTVKTFVEVLKLLATTSKSKNPPGMKAIWIGFSKLTFLLEVYDIFT